MYDQTTPPRRPKTMTPGVTVTIIAVIIAAPFVVVAWLGGMSGAIAAGTPTGPRLGHTSGPAATPTDTPSDTPSEYTPTPADFDGHVKILSKDCFGTAGCNLTYRVKLDYSGASLDPTRQYEVSYTVTGSSDGAQMDTATVTGDSYQVTDEEIASTPSSGTKLRVEITDVEQVS